SKSHGQTVQSASVAGRNLHRPILPLGIAIRLVVLLATTTRTNGQPDSCAGKDCQKSAAPLLKKTIDQHRRSSLRCYHLILAEHWPESTSAGINGRGGRLMTKRLLAALGLIICA